MKIVSYFDGQVRLSVSWDEIRPINGIPHSVVVNLLQEAYQFEQAGQSPLAREAGMFLPMLAQGGFTANDSIFTVSALEFRPDAIVATCPHSDIAQLFLDDVIKKLITELGFRPPDKEREKSFRSTIVSDLGSDLTGLLGKWVDVVEMFKSFSKKPERNISAYSLKFGSFGDETSSDDDMVIEKRYSAPAGEQWLYTQMALDTSSHEKVLELIYSSFLVNKK